MTRSVWHAGCETSHERKRLAQAWLSGLGAAWARCGAARAEAAWTGALWDRVPRQLTSAVGGRGPSGMGMADALLLASQPVAGGPPLPSHCVRTFHSPKFRALAEPLNFSGDTDARRTPCPCGKRCAGERGRSARPPGTRERNGSCLHSVAHAFAGGSAVFARPRARENNRLIGSGQHHASKSGSAPGYHSAGGRLKSGWQAAGWRHW